MESPVGQGALEPGGVAEAGMCYRKSLCKPGSWCEPAAHLDSLGQLVRAPGSCSCSSKQGKGRAQQMVLSGTSDNGEFPPVWQMLFA